MHVALRRFLTIVVGSTILTCVLGICLDLVTANVAVEYFSVHHPKIIATDNPWALALVWGVAASWWFGAMAGAVVASINHRRKQPLEPSRILRWTAIACIALWLIMVAILLAVMVISSTIPIERRPVTFESDRRLVAVAMAHQYEYILGAVALLVICAMTWRARLKRHSTKSDEPSHALEPAAGPNHNGESSPPAQ
ncbi:MAG: hypothetical protein KF851_14170 [Pirellulaceae bacterium]|nr:hypothetical protein [Pirellulaceae bacterium]